MSKAEAHSRMLPNEAEITSGLRNHERLSALTQTQLLDTPPEESLDRLTRLAAKLIHVPATFISLVDEERLRNGGEIPGVFSPA